jgi:hypothetical protein
MSDNVIANPGVGGATFRTLDDGAVEWPANVVSYATTLTPGANVLQPVTAALGLPVVAATSATWAATQSGTWTVQPGNTPNTVAWKVDGSAVTQPVSNANLDVALSTRLKPADTLAGITAVGSITNALPAGSNTIGKVDQGIAGASAWLVSGPLTDTQLRATAVPVSGTFWQTTQPVSIAATVAVAPTYTDASPVTQNVTAQDLASTTTVGANSQSLITGTATAGSTASFTLASGYDTIRVLSTGTWTGTLAFEVSMDGGTTWTTQGLHQTGTAYTAAAFTANFTGQGNAAGINAVRVRATAAWTGTATIKVVQSLNPGSVYVGNALKLQDSTVNSVQNTIKAASTAAVAADTALVVAVSPNNTVPVSVASLPLPSGAAIETGNLALLYGAEQASVLPLLAAILTELRVMNGVLLAGLSVRDDLESLRREEVQSIQ